MMIHIKINSELISSLPNWDDLSKAIMKNMVELHLYGVIPQSCNVEADLTTEELERFKDEL